MTLPKLVPLALGLLAFDLVECFVNYGNVYPTAYALGNGPELNATTPYGKTSLLVSASQPFLTLEYGTEQAGFLFFEIGSLSGPTQVERWETVRLLTNTTVTFNRIGFNSTAAHVPIPKLPGRLSTSNKVYDDIWALGGRVTQVACVDTGNAPSTWEITEHGALIRGQGTAQSVKGASFSNYSLSFATRILRAGTGWRIASAQNPQGAYFVLTSDYPLSSTYVNTNRTLLPANTIAFTYGTSFLQQETATTNPVQYFPVNVRIEENQWYNISTSITPTAYVVEIKGALVASVSIAGLPPLVSYLVQSSPYSGSFGFGPFQDQAAYFTDVRVVAQNSTLLYQNDLKSEGILSEYAQATLHNSVCMDGAKRDRLVWTGDFYHTGNVVASSTARFDYRLGTIEYILARQLTDAPYKCLVPISPYLGGNATSLQPYWQQVKALVSARMTFIDPCSDLIGTTPEIPTAFNFLGPANSSAVTALNAYALKSLVPLAYALKDSDTAQLCAKTANDLTTAINKHLWNPNLGTYSLSLAAPSNFSLTAIAWTILSDTANSSQATSSIAKLVELRCGVGYKTVSSDVCSGDYEISPNTNGFLLNALFKAHRDLGVKNSTVEKAELDDFWSATVSQNEYYSGASWEYTHPDGSPGIERFTSLAHPWGAAPTYVLPVYVLGIAATSAGYKTWTFPPLLESLELTDASGRGVTPYGDIVASWDIIGEAVVISATVPKGTKGTLVLPKGCTVRYGGRQHRGGRVELQAGQRAQVRVREWRQ